MKFASVLNVVLAACCICGAAQAKNPWVKKNKDDREDGFNKILSKQAQPSSVDSIDSYSSLLNTGGLGGMGGLGGLGGLGDSGFGGDEMMKVIEDALDSTIEMLSDPKQRRDLMTPETINELIEQLPAAARQAPELQALQKVLQGGDTQSAEYRKQLDESLDIGLALAKKLQRLLKHPEEMPKLMEEAMDMLNIPEDDKKKYKQLLENPEELQAAMQQFATDAAAGMQAGMAGLEEGVDEYMKLLDDPAALTQRWEEMMQDPEIQAALAGDPETAQLLAELMADPAALQAGGGAAAEGIGAGAGGSSGFMGKGTKRKDAPAARPAGRAARRA